jgi:molybdenum cofactor guanylyltransferase
MDHAVRFGKFAVSSRVNSSSDRTNDGQRVGGIILCGGRSSRMGRPKAWLPFGDQTMLQRVVDVLREVVDPIVVVAAPDQEVPPVPEGVVIVRDAEEGLGPLAGLAAGLEALADVADAAYASSCDVPLLSAAFVRAVIDRLDDAEIAIPREDAWHHPLAAVYRTSLAQRCRELIAGGRRRPLHLVQASRSNEFDVGELRTVDRELRSLRNANTPKEYELLLELSTLDDG